MLAEVGMQWGDKGTQWGGQVVRWSRRVHWGFGVATGCLGNVGDSGVPEGVEEQQGAHRTWRNTGVPRGRGEQWGTLQTSRTAVPVPVCRGAWGQGGGS